ncbi:helix-turn-helix domain-containing protein [Citrobacter koseri]|uniref:helix-turn-helix domain-containing protein n=1 Tax=Citrobacter TaxID=544 RepID=UPI0018842D7F|nr:MULTISPECIES: helix-turn-helix domain-containing protein [Citrobacter]ELJ2664926.1 helix-turn-helix domain-containing protein [Citrobacter koseri]MBE9969180.1 helix-turn-helix domain-containing protein [Citrobacter freundii]MBE9975566.1 helix-turn-helix domain-containing protein [Citrobacter freundii]MBE9985153.1 helix-turn-helix domain-containing protein [Citrobacter freundii]MBF0064521.1 helix-turn-helix domain-containing protein [Citrobacter freundii]
MSEITLGQRIRQRRKQIGLSQNELSKTAGVSESSVSLWESDNTAPRGANLHKLASALQCSPTWLLFGDTDQTPEEPRPTDTASVLKEDEQELLRLYRALPESEQITQIEGMKARVENFNRLFNELLEARKRNNQP